MRVSNTTLKLIVSPKSVFFDRIYQEILDIISLIAEYTTFDQAYHLQSAIDSTYYRLHKHPVEKIPDYISSKLKELSSKIIFSNKKTGGLRLINRNIGDIVYYKKFKDKKWQNIKCYYPYLHTISSNRVLIDYLESQKYNSKFDINIRDTFYNTALSVAVNNNELDKVKILVKYGAVSSKKYHHHYRTALHLSIFSSPEIFQFLYNLKPNPSFESDKIENLLEEFIITHNADRNLSFVFKELRSSKDRFDFEFFIQKAIETDSDLLLEYALSNEKIKSDLYRSHYLWYYSYFFRFLLSSARRGQEDLSIFKFLISKYPPDIFDLSSKKNQEDIYHLFYSMVISKCNIIFYQCVIQTLIKQNCLSSLTEIRKSFKELTSFPYISISGNPLITALAFGQENIANLFFRYGAEIPPSAKSGMAYLGDCDHPIKVSIRANCPKGIDLLYKYGITTSVEPIKDLSFSKDLYNYALETKKYECAEKLKEIFNVETSAPDLFSLKVEESNSKRISKKIFLH